ncbi:MAG: hypothetical protein H6810_06175 [Phycisphaeraceae bacterium]|nr:MAG: hypothetical protein H6810_06175 [Phycisphaeraceae bacterium]
MELAIKVIVALAGVVVMGVLGLTVALMKLVMSMANGDVRIEPLDEGELPKMLSDCAEHIEQGEVMGFAVEEVYRVSLAKMPPLDTVVLSNPNRCDFFAVTRTAKGDLKPSFSSVREVRHTPGRVSVDTHSDSSEKILPKPPDTFGQAFEGLSVAELHERHAEGVRHLESQVPTTREPLPIGLAAMLRQGVMFDAKYVMRRPLWILRLPYWTLIRKRQLVNRPIADRWPAGHPRFAQAAATPRVYS